MTGEPIVRPTAWRLMTAAFCLWAANFLVGYAAALIAPEHWATRFLLVALALGSIPLLLWIVRKSVRLQEAGIVFVATAVAAVAILFNAVAAIA